MYYLRLGVTGAAISTIVSQYVLSLFEFNFLLLLFLALQLKICAFIFSRYIVTFLMIWYLNKRTVLSLPSVKTLHFGGYLRSGEYFLLR